MSEFSGSDLTDLEDDYDAPPALTGKHKQNSDGDYKIRGALKAPRAINLSTQALHEQLVGNDISLEADYQRDVVWPINKQIGLIDSLFRNFYVPPLIFSVSETPDGALYRICIDGKQRLTSIWRFMEGLIPYKDAFTNEKFFYKDLPNRTEKGKLLPERYRKIFRNKQLVCMEYSELSDNNEREIFQRVQLGMALTPAEKLQAIHSTASTFVHELLQEYVRDALEENLDWETSRATDFRCLCTAIYILEKESVNPPGVGAIQKWLQSAGAFDDDFIEDLHQTFKIFTWLAQNKEYKHCFKIDKDGKTLKISPAEFVTIAILIFRHKSRLTFKQLSEAIRKMRLDVRKSEQDIRMNSRVIKLLLAFIKGLKVSQLKADSGSQVASSAIEKVYKPKPKLEDMDDREEETASPSKGSAKRKRPQDDSDDDYDPPKSSIQKSSTRQSLPSQANARPSASTPKQPVASSSIPPPRPPQPPVQAPPPQPPPPPRPHTPTAPRFQSSRLAALHAVKAIPVPMYQPTNGAQSQSLPLTPNGTWGNSSVMRMGPMVPVADVGPPPPSAHNDLSSSLMSRMPSGSYRDDKNYAGGYNDNRRDSYGGSNGYHQQGSGQGYREYNRSYR